MKIITYNIHKGMDLQNKDTLDELLSFFKNINADIICIQEVLESIHFRILNDLNIQGYFLKTVELKGDNYGIAIYFTKCVNYVDGFYLSSKKSKEDLFMLNFL
ncbi:endonuclease/exonuclease/phosphatase family protein [Paraclostridium bifermentans]|uniref:Endonuclease/exonuclease/phosphatase family protein n=1 Tax=Paraclostridium bifermentans TaxID=1490 RepID=A0ABY8R278_PARBF|nr:endonuclease/exonuclease/phosphatase family protein [Paraclostridium bifermentans]